MKPVDIRRERSLPVKSLHKKENEANQERSQRISKIVRVLKKILGAIFVGSFLYTLWYIVHLPRYTISDVATEGIVIGDAETMKTYIDTYLSEKRAMFFPKKSTFFFSEKELISRIERDFPLYFVRIEPVGFIKKDTVLTRQVIVIFHERSYKYLWCKKDQVLKGDRCIYADEEGILFYTAPTFSGSPYIRFYTEDVKEIGARILEKDSFKKNIDFIVYLQSKGFKVTDVLFGTDEDMLTFTQEGSNFQSQIRLSHIYPLEEAQENLRVFLEKKEVYDELYKSGARIEYIDLRYKDRVFYKMQIQ